FFFSSRRRHTSFSRDWSSDVCSSDLTATAPPVVFHTLSISTGSSVEPSPDHPVSTPEDRLLPEAYPPDHHLPSREAGAPLPRSRSEERRVGKECRVRLAPCAQKDVNI